MKEVILKADFLDYHGKSKSKKKDKNIKEETKEVTGPKGKESAKTDKIEGITFDDKEKDKVFMGRTFSDGK